MLKTRLLVCGVSIAAAALTAACSGDAGNGMTVAPPPISAAVVYGTVTNSLGAPVVNATVDAGAFALNCSGQTVASGGTTTDVNGHYRILVSAQTAPRTMCVAVIAYGRGSADSAVASFPSVEFRAQPPAQPNDSVELSLVLP
jgi:hypothetical protein